MSAEGEMVHRVDGIERERERDVNGGESFFFLSLERNGALFLLLEAWMMIGMTDECRLAL